jgi:RimJ/RimL family protein N-acetyltransferase
MNLHSIEQLYENKASAKVLEKNGFVQEGLLKKINSLRVRF